MRPRPCPTFAVQAAWLLGVLVLGGFAAVGAREAAGRESLVRAAAALGAHQVDGAPDDFELRTLDGGTVSLSALAAQGEVVFLNFWATWCPPCREELPAMADLARRMAEEGRPFRMVAVSQDEGWQALREFFGAAGPPAGITVALDPPGRLSRMYGTEKLPETYVIGRKGRVLARWVNVRPWSSPQMVEWFERALASGL